MADPNQQGGGGDGKQKGGGGGGAKDGITMSGNINAASMVGGWPAVKKSIGDHSLNAFGFIMAGLAVHFAKTLVYKLLGVDEGAAVKPKPNPYEAVGVLYEVQKENPAKFDAIKSKHPGLFSNQPAESSAPASSGDNAG